MTRCVTMAAMGPAPGGFYPRPDHEIVPQPGSVFSLAGHNTGRAARLTNASHYPVEALCMGCDEVIQSPHFYAGWYHTGRKPGDPRPEEKQ